MDRRALPGLLSGLAGCAFGVAGAELDSQFLTVAAAAFALVAGAASLVVLRDAQRAEARAVAAASESLSLRQHELTPSERGRSALVDPDSGLPDARFFELALETRVAAARRHLWPVTIVLLELGPANAVAPAALGRFAALLRDTLREADVICRLGARTFGLLLEDTSEAGGVWAAERLQVALARDGGFPGRSLAAGVASYPTHGLQAGEVVSRARVALGRACATEPGHGLGQVEVAQSDSH